ncbi:MAG: hypothetical protein FGM33_01805 [Candidatus Kapabacteria bacterium]|nr:hypothetical protein [Candidatus Kapabacteria bacterium]
MNFLWWRSIAVAVFVLGAVTVSADINRDTKNRKGSDAEDVQRTPTGVFDQQRNNKSKIDFITTNYGIFGFDVVNGQGGAFWPRGRNNQYLFAGGAWFGARKRPPGSDTLRKRVMITYNPNSGRSWMVPGSVNDGPLVNSADAFKNKYRTYFSTDFSDETGVEKINSELPNWPIWDNDATKTLRVNNYFGNYVDKIEDRTRLGVRNVPAFVSGEDVFCTYKDTDLSRYEGGAPRRRAEGFPLGFQIEQIVYSWGFGDYGDILFMKYLFIHPEQFGDTLYDCWMAAVQDVDIALRTNSAAGAANDRARYYNERPDLNLAVQWTNGDRGEAGQGFGYLGFNFLESPAVDADKFIRNDKSQFPVSEQLGLQTMRNWPIVEDPLENEDRYNFISSQRRDGDLGPGDRRLMMATGPFNMRPGDSARIVIGIVLASTAKGGDADGTVEDMAELIRKVQFAQFVYDNAFIAPVPPREANFKFKRTGPPASSVPVGEDGWFPFNNGVAIQWDSASELSVDTLEQGLDFMGYRLYRARRTDLDTFDTDFRLNARKGPLGWKQIAQFVVPSPYSKFGEIVPSVEGVKIDQFRVVDVVKPNSRRALVARTLNFAEPWGSYFAQLQNNRDPRRLRNGQVVYNTNSDGTLKTSGFTNGVPNFDKLDSIQFCYMRSKIDTIPAVSRLNTGAVDDAQALRATDSLIRFILKRQVVLEPFRFPEVDQVTLPDGSVVDEVKFRPFEELNEVRKGLIARHIRRLTNNRTFIDIGDDNRNGTVEFSTDPERSEKLINNVDYYYALRAFDEGDYSNATESKLNDRANANTIATSPRGARPGESVQFELTTDAENAKRLGGIYNIRLLVNDQQRFNQLFAGRTLNLTFNRIWDGFPYKNNQNDLVGLYGALFTLRDSATGDEIAQWSSLLPPVLCGLGREGRPFSYFTEQTRTWVDAAFYDDGIDSIFDLRDTSLIRVDTVTFGFDTSREKKVRAGSYTTDVFCENPQYAFGTIGLAFDYAIEQWGGVYRADTAYIVNGPANIAVTRANTVAGLYNFSNALNPAPPFIELPYPGFVPRVPWPISYNNGPGVYEITFKGGGRESLTTKFALNTTDDVGKDSTMTFPDVEYLEYEIRNSYSFMRADAKPDGTIDSVAVSYPFNLTPQSIDYSSVPPAEQRNYPNAELVTPGSFAAASFGWRNSRNGEWSPARLRFYAAQNNSGRPLGQQLRYYKSRTVSTTGKDTLDFVNVISIGGAQFVLDASLRGRRTSSNSVVPNAPTTANPPTAFPSEDFKPGDKVVVSTFGGAFGFPFDNATAKIRVKQYDKFDAATKTDSYTDENMEQVQVVPNPFYVSHEGMSSPFQGKIYFTRLPRVCTINIYTVNGELVRTIEHNELDPLLTGNTVERRENSERAQIGADVWDLLTRSQQSKRRAVSQMFIAKIETPSGASVIRKFAVVVGPARFVGEGE